MNQYETYITTAKRRANILADQIPDGTWLPIQFMLDNPHAVPYQEHGMTPAERETWLISQIRRGRAYVEFGRDHIGFTVTACT